MSFIYDVPGPRTQRKIRIASVISALALFALVGAALWQFGSHDQLNPQRWAPFTQWVVWQYLLTGLLGTLQSAGIVAVFASVLGTFLALGRLSRGRPVRWLCTAYIEVARTVPVLLLIYLMLFGLPQLGINVPPLWKMVIPLTFVTSAVFAEIVRAGITSLPSGQAEAALSLGLRQSQTMRLVVLPQALRNIAPSLLTQFVSLLKDTTLGYIVAYTELLYRGQLLTSYINQLIPTYIVVAFIYLVVSGSLTALASRLQKRTTAKSTVLPLLPPSIPVLERAQT
ncbi:amino acid ABC transporter permease [Arthrobacter sp. A2-55]|uniref:amino acid ABC transporter permease n=1 Tax=Arthrobacter sp. A2-55 TaxID=2897337 RepID=UPI0021CD7A67|nr:amino acid ABC transporter permease [Arthrobacter sp. A2-55]MCU6481951.1 amino acid ABC transporter permease [Arthrobacter sp. A2-55]